MDGDGGGSGDSEAPHIDRSLPMSRLCQGGEGRGGGGKGGCCDAAELEETGRRKGRAKAKTGREGQDRKGEEEEGREGTLSPFPRLITVIHQDEKYEYIVQGRDPRPV